MKKILEKSGKFVTGKKYEPCELCHVLSGNCVMTFVFRLILPSYEVIYLPGL